MSSTQLSTAWIKILDSSKFRWFFLFGTSGVCILLFGIGYYFQRKQKSNPKSIQLRPGSSQLVRSGIWRSIHFGSVTHTPAVDTSSLTPDQLFENGVVSFQQGVNSWRACCEMLSNHRIESDTEVLGEESDRFDSHSSGAASSIPVSPHSNLNQRRLRALLLQSQLVAQLIESVKYTRNVENVFSERIDSEDMQLLEDNRASLSSPRIALPYDTEPERESTVCMDDSSDSFESATLLSDLEGYSTRSRKSNFSTPRIIIRTNNLYHEALDLAVQGDIYVRHMRTEMLRCDHDTDFTAKLHCVRLAFDFLIKSEENCTFFENQTRQLMTRFLTKAKKDGEAFSREFTEIVNFVKNPENYPITERELNVRKLNIVGFWDVAIDFALLDAFTDLENLPTPVTMVTQNRWLTPGLRESALVSAVWAVMQGKIKMLENKDGFMSRFYKLGETFMFTLAWGFLGTDEELKERCGVLKEGILSYFRDIFDLKMANYSDIHTLSEDILRLGRYRLQDLDSHL